ncbi:MAG: alkaline phosphatase family protein [Anaerolineales bacterium]
MNSTQQSTHPRVVLILVDGMRPDGLELADTPNMDAIVHAGTFTLKAETTFPSVTLPCHTSLFLSVPPERHGILTNTWVPQVRPVPGLFEVLHQSGKIAGSFYNWEQLRDLSSPGSLAISLMLRNLESPDVQADWELTQSATKWLTTHHFDFAFIYLGKTDVAGHDHGWMSQPYLAAIQEADRCIGHIIGTLPRDTYYFVMADHGGHDRSHGTQLIEDMRIPILTQGPGIQVGHPLEADVSILDVAPSILRILDIPQPKEWMGVPRFF